MGEKNRSNLNVYLHIPYRTREKCTSTLNSKLKKDISTIYKVLVENVYQRSAYIAHTKIAYVAKGKDHYDSHEHKHVPTDVSECGEKYRKAEGRYIFI